MISIDPTILIVMGEVIFALLVVIVIFLVRWGMSRKRDKEAVTVLEGRLSRNANTRQEWFTKMMAEGKDDIDPAMKDMACGWVEKENKFYGRLIEMYMQRDSTAIRSLDKLLHEYSSSYLELVTNVRDQLDKEKAELSEEIKAQIEKMAGDGVKLAQEMELLHAENERLSNELAGAYAEIEQAMKEYSMAFRPGGMSGSNTSVSSPPQKPAAAASVPPAESLQTETKQETPVVPPTEEEAAPLIQEEASEVAAIETNLMPDEQTDSTGELEDVLPTLDEAIDNLEVTNAVAPSAPVKQAEPPTLEDEMFAAGGGGVDEAKLLAALEGEDGDIQLPNIDMNDDVIDLADEALDDGRTKKNT